MSKLARDRKRMRRYMRRIARLALPLLIDSTHLVIGKFNG
jgi:RNase P protein component